MTLFCLRAASPLRALALSLGLSLVASAGFAADEAGSGTFNAPVYAPAAAASGPPGYGQPMLNPRTPVPPRGASGQGLPGQPRASEFEPRRVELAPSRPSEFQKFVEAATGRRLPLFGASFFVDAALNMGARLFYAFSRLYA